VPRASTDVILEGDVALEEEHDNENWSDVDDDEEDDDDDDNLTEEMDALEEELITPEITEARARLQTALEAMVVGRDPNTEEIDLECLL